MTNIQDVTVSIQEIINEHPHVSELLNQWIQNDIIKMYLCQAYDDWMADIYDHNNPLTLKEHIIVYIENHQYFGNKTFHL